MSIMAAHGMLEQLPIFQSFSDAFVWNAQNKFHAIPIFSVLDDFLFVAESEYECRKSVWVSGVRQQFERSPSPGQDRVTVSLPLLPWC